MPSPLLDEHRPNFDERSNYIFIVLGLVSFARRMERLAADAARRPSIRSSGKPSVESDGFMYFALGAIALSQRFLQQAHESRKSSPVDTASNDFTSAHGLPRNIAL